MKKNLISILIVTLIISLLAGCSGQQEGVSKNDVETKIENVEVQNNQEHNHNEEHDEKNCPVCNGEEEEQPEKDKLLGYNTAGCPLIHLVPEERNTSDSDVIDGLQFSKIHYSISKLDDLFVEENYPDDSYGTIFITRVGTNKPSDIERITDVSIKDVSTENYDVDFFDNGCCRTYVFRVKMPISEEDLEVYFGVNDYGVYKKPSEVEQEVFVEFPDGIVVDKSTVIKLKDKKFFISDFKVNLETDVSTENKNVVLLEDVVELMPVDGSIKLDKLDETEWYVIDREGNDMNDFVDEDGGTLTYTIVTVSPEYRNKYNSDLVHSVYVLYKYENSKYSGDELKSKLEKLLKNTSLCHFDKETDYVINFVR